MPETITQNGKFDDSGANKTPETPENPEIMRDDGPESAAAAIVETIRRESAVAEKISGPETPAKINKGDQAWKLEPLKNFETTGDGKTVKLNRDGSPVRKPGRPRKPRKGDTLANGEKYQPTKINRSKPSPTPTGQSAQAGPSVPPLNGVQPVGPDGSGSGGGPAVAGGQGDTLGEDAGRVLVDALGNTAAAILGDKAKPTADEASSMSRHASRTMGGITLPAWAAFLTVAGIWLLRVYGTRPRKKIESKSSEKKDEEKRSAHSDNRHDPERQDGVREAIGQGYTW